MSAGVLAGLAGGLAEILWIALYQGGSNGAAAIARGVSRTVLPGAASLSHGVLLGIAIHMTLAILLGVSIAAFVRASAPRIRGTMAESVSVMGILIAVWAVNFLVILPAISPEFVALVPLGVSFVSKTLFGVAAASVFWLSGSHSNLEETTNVK